MDVLGTILFLVVMVFFQRRQKAIVRAVDEDSIEISDYSVTVRGLPEDATDKEEVRCFFELKFGKVVDAVLAKNDGVLVTLYKKRGELAMRHDALHSKFIKTKKGEAHGEAAGENRRHRRENHRAQEAEKLQDETRLRHLQRGGKLRGVPQRLSADVAGPVAHARDGAFPRNARVHGGGGARAHRRHV